MDLYLKPENEFVAQFIGSPSMNLLPGEIAGTGDETVVRLENGGTAHAAITTTSADMGLKVNLGVRPEDLTLTEGEALFEGEVDITEALGEVTILYFRKDAEGRQMIAKLPGIHGELRNRSVKLTAEPSKVHLFNHGRSLRYR